MTHRVRRVLALSLASSLSLVAVLIILAHGGRTQQVQLGLPPPPPSGLVVPLPILLPASVDVTRWAAVERPVVARAAPASTARGVERVSTRTPEGTSNIVELLGPARRQATGPWQRVLLATLPIDSTGWVPRAALGGSMFVDTRLVIDRRRLTATFFRAGQRVMSVPVGVGQPQWPTPAGSFYVRNVLTQYAGAEYGPVAFGTSARSPTLTDWPAGGYIGIHGTDRPDLIPGAISHGCIRMRNPDILRLARVMPVGTPVIVR